MVRALAWCTVFLMWVFGCSGAAPRHVEPVQTTTESMEPADRILYMVITDRFENGDPSNDGVSDPSGVLAFHGGDFAGLAGRVGYLAELGVTTVWMTPIVEQIGHPVGGEDHPPHWGYHGYWAEHFDRLEPRLGSEADLTRLLAAAHGVGLEVVLDVVINHSGYGSHFADDRSWSRVCSGQSDDLTMCLFGLPDLLTEDPTVAEQVIAWQLDWITRFDFDGIRADTVKHVERTVWRELLARVRAVRGDRPPLLLGESWGTAPTTADEPLLSDGMFNALYDFEFSGLVEGYLNGRLRPVAFAHHLAQRNDPAIGRYVHYLNTHDTDTMVSLLNTAEAYDVALVLLLTSAGMPLLYYGDEIARRGGSWPNNRPDMDWASVDGGHPALGLVRELTRLRRAHPALSRGRFETVQVEDGLLVFAREWQGERVLVGVNRGPDAASIECDNELGCQPLFCDGCGVEDDTVVLAPWGAVVIDESTISP